WYVPPRPTFWSLVRTEWNAVSANVLFDPRRAFAWGGSCAVRRDHLPVLRLEDRWREVLSDDLVLSQAVRDAGLKIAYAPAALVPAVVKAFVRRRALFSAAPSVATAWKVPPWRVAFAALAVPWVMAWGLVRTRRPTSVRWRGHVYDVRDPQRIRLLDPRRGPNPDSKDPSG